MSGIDDTRGGGNVASITTYKGKDGSTFKVAKTTNGALYKLDGTSSQKVDGLTASSLGSGVKESFVVNSGGSGGTGGEQRRADMALFDASQFDSSAQDAAFAAANDFSDESELSAGLDWSGGRALAYELAGQAGIDAYNQGVDTGLEIGSYIAPLPPVAIGAKYGYRAYQTSKILKGRQRYVGAVTALSKQVVTMRQAGVSSEAIARTVHTSRRSLGVKFKNLTPADLLKKIYTRNTEKYGDKLGPSIDYLRRRGKSWEDIIESATRAGGKDLGL